MSHLSHKIREHELAPKKTHKPDLTYHHKIHIDLPMHQVDLFVYLSVFNEGEDIVRNISYELSRDIKEKGIIDLYFQLLEARALESLNRITTKELDYYLRDDVKQGIFDYYDDKFYEVLSIGEEILKVLRPTDKKQKIYNGTEEDFFELSMSAQVEVMEEFFAETVYKHPRFHKIDFDVLDVDKYKISLSVNDQSEDLDFYLKTEIQDQLRFLKTEILLFLRKNNTN